jgi:hypothetical protein
MSEMAHRFLMELGVTGSKQKDEKTTGQHSLVCSGQISTALQEAQPKYGGGEVTKRMYVKI